MQRLFSHNKKGAAWSRPILDLTLVLVTAAILFTVTTGFIEKSENITPYLTECKATLGLEKIFDAVNLGSLVNDACYTLKLGDLNKIKNIDDKKRFITNRLVQVSDATWGGTKNLFDTDSVLQEAGIDCRSFFELDYSAPVREESISFEELQKFLIKEYYGDTGQTYSQILRGKKDNVAWWIMDNLEPGETYAVSLFNPRAVSVWKRLANVAIKSGEGTGAGLNMGAIMGPGAWIGAGVGFVTGAAIGTYEQFFAENPYQKSVLLFSKLSTADAMGCVQKGES